MESTKTTTVKVRQETRDALRAACEAAGGITSDQMIVEALQAVEAQRWGATNQEWSQTAEDVRSHLDAVAHAFVTLAEGKAELVRSTREESARTVAALQQALAQAQDDAGELATQLEEARTALAEARASLAERDGQLASAREQLDEARRSAVTVEDVLRAVREGR